MSDYDQERNRLLYELGSEPNPEAAKRLYYLAGRKEDWLTAKLAVDYILGVEAQTSEKKGFSGRVYYPFCSRQISLMKLLREPLLLFQSETPKFGDHYPVGIDIKIEGPDLAYHVSLSHYDFDFQLQVVDGFQSGNTYSLEMGVTEFFTLQATFGKFTIILRPEFAPQAYEFCVSNNAKAFVSANFAYDLE